MSRRRGNVERKEGNKRMVYGKTKQNEVIKVTCADECGIKTMKEYEIYSMKDVST